MARRDLYQHSSEDREVAELEYVLRADKKIKAGGGVPVVAVDKALQSEGVYEVQSERNVVRVLFISRDESLLNPSQQSLDGFINLAELFDEVHILILRHGIAPKNPVLRVAPNVWIYTAAAQYWWWTPVAGMRLIAQELVFVGGLRPDLIVARDPFESAVLAHFASRHYLRPAQVHVLQDYTRPEFVAAERYNRWRRFIPRFVLPRVVSVRTATYALKTMLEKRFTLQDLKVLPRFNNYEALIGVPATIDLRDRYKPFAFIMVYIGRLGHDSTFYRVLDAARTYLQNPRVGLLVLGEGSARKEFEKRAKTLGVERQVVFITGEVDPVPYLKSANVLVVSDIDSDGDDAALRGAACGTPLLLARNHFRDDVFVDGASALLFAPESTDELAAKVQTIITNVPLRAELAVSARAVVREHFHADPVAYKTAYRATIEETLFVGEEESPSSLVS